MQLKTLGLLKRLILSVLLFFFVSSTVAIAQEYQSQKLLNDTNWADLIGNYLGYLYDSHGCLHFTPSDIYLLTKTINNGTALEIESYSQTVLPKGYETVPIFRTIIKTPSDLSAFNQRFDSERTKIVVYPGLEKLFILVDGSPVTQMDILPGPPDFYRQVYGLSSKGKVDWDNQVMTPTDGGSYRILGTTDHYLSNTYRETTIVPFGAWITKSNNQWVFQEKGEWYELPAAVAADLEQPYGSQDLSYYDLSLDSAGKIQSARWAGNDFGKYALLWTKDGTTSYPELGYTEGQLLLEQTLLVKDLANVLTVDGPDTLDAVLAQNLRLQGFKDVFDFVSSKGQIVPDSLSPTACAYVRLYSGWPLSDDDKARLNAQAVTAFNDYTKNQLPANHQQREQSIGLYNYIRDYAREFDKEAGYYSLFKDNWNLFSDLRMKLRNDFMVYGLYSQTNKQITIERFINDRLEFRLINPPEKPVKLTFGELFKPDQEQSLFEQREKDALKNVIRLAASGEVSGLEFASVTALNNTNLGGLLNQMLGNLYKSHGCLHVSPLNVYILNKTLPVGTKITIKEYSEKADLNLYKDLPSLASMVSFDDDVAKLKSQLSNQKDVSAIAYPGSSVWIVYLKGKPFAKMAIEPGFPFQVKILRDRDKNGVPIFDENIAYPSPSGNYYVFKKYDNYVSNLYYDTTVIPQGAKISRDGDVWKFQSGPDKWTKVPDDISDDLNLPTEKQAMSYYDQSYDANGQLTGAKFGSNSFGRWPIQLSRDRKTPAPELVHTTGDLIMENRQLVGDLIGVLTAPKDSFEDCIKYSKNYDLYQSCYNLIQDPTKKNDFFPIESGSYKLYMGFPLTPEENTVIPADAKAAFKVFKKNALTKEESDLLVKEKIASYKNGELVMDQAKIYGILYDLYQYVVSIEKNANIYSVLQSRWIELMPIRQAMLRDLNQYVITDPDVFKEFYRELIIERVELKRLNQPEALRVLNQLLNEN